MLGSYVLVTIILLNYMSTIDAKVVMVYSIQRHGARNVLPKTALLQESESIGGPSLLPEGQKQAYLAGKAYRERYVSAITCNSTSTCLPDTNEQELYGVINTPGVEFNNFNMDIRSSGLDRTIMTALSFLTGVLPPENNATEERFLPDGQQVVPVFSQPDSEDIVIRAYSKCTAYQEALSQWFGSPQFLSKAEESAALRANVQALVPAMNASLENWWNVYDAFNVWRTYGVGDPTPDIDEATFQSMKELANWLETAKMSSTLTGAMVGGTILADLLQRVDRAVQAVQADVPVYYKVLHLSGHYNTQLGVLSALALDTHPAAADTPWLRKIPSLAALMAFEVVASSSSPPSFAIRLVLQDGPDAPYQPVPLPCATAGDEAEQLAGAGACTLEAFQRYVAPRTLTTLQWCQACGDTSTTACQLSAAAAELASLRAALGGTGEARGGNLSCSSDDWKIAVGVVVTFVGTVLLAVLCMLWMRSHYRAQRFVSLGSVMATGHPLGSKP